jgi:hypothetical protein
VLEALDHRGRAADVEGGEPPRRVIHPSALEADEATISRRK